METSNVIDPEMKAALLNSDLWASSVPCNITYKVAASLTATSKNHVAVNGNYQSDTTDLLPGMVIRTGFWVAACMHACMQEQQDGPRRSMCISLRPFMFWQHLWLAGRKNSGLCQKKNRRFSLSKIIVPFSISKMTFARHFFSPFGEIGSCSISLSYEYHKFCERPNPLESCVFVVFSWRWILLLHIYCLSILA